MRCAVGWQNYKLLRQELVGTEKALREREQRIKMHFIRISGRE